MKNPKHVLGFGILDLFGSIGIIGSIGISAYVF